MAGIGALRRLQLGKDAGSPFTAVPCTALVAGISGYKPKIGDQKVVQPIDDHGSLAESSRSYTTMTEWQAGFDGNVTYEDIGYWLGMTVKSIPAGVTVETTARLFTWTPSMTALNSPDTRTAKIGDDGQALMATGVFGTSLQLSATHDDVWKFSISLVGQAASTTVFDSLSDRSAEEAVGAKTKFYVDASGGTIGSTQKTVTLIDWTWKLPAHFLPKRRQDGQLTLVGFNEKKMKPTLDLTVEWNATAEALRVQFQAETRILVRLKTTGTVVGAASATKFMTLDGAYKVLSIDIMDEKDGATVAKLSLAGEYDSTYGKLFEIAVQNGVNAFP